MTCRLYRSYVVLVLLLSLLAFAAYAEQQTLSEYLSENDKAYSPELAMIGSAFHGPGYHSQVPDGTWVHSTNGSLYYALALLQSGEAEHVERAAAVIAKVISLQDIDPVSKTYGIWSWLFEEPLSDMAPPDWNWADFCGVVIGQILVEHSDTLPPDLVSDMHESIGHAAWSIFRRNVKPGYTNIAVMGAGVTLMAGEITGEERLLAYGRRRLRGIVEHHDAHGSFNEYNSPPYTMVVLHECERVLQFVKDEQARADAEMLRRAVWRLMAEHYHPATGQWAAPHSRGYKAWLDARTANYIAEQTGVAIPVHPAEASEGVVGPSLTKSLPCPEDLVDRFRKLPEPTIEVHQRVILRDTAEASTYMTTWLTHEACLGSVNHDNMWTQRRVLMAYWNGEDGVPVALRLRFLHDGEDFASAYVRNAQVGNRILSAVSLVTNRGDFHDHLDHPDDLVFEAEDFRLRYELTGEGAQVAEIGDDRYELRAGQYRAVVHTAPGRFGPHSIRWESGGSEGIIWVDAVVDGDSSRTFDFKEFSETIMVGRLELLEADEDPSMAPLEITRSSDGYFEASWAVPGDPQVRVPLKPHLCIRID